MEADRGYTEQRHHIHGGWLGIRGTEASYSLRLSRDTWNGGTVVVEVE